MTASPGAVVRPGWRGGDGLGGGEGASRGGGGGDCDGDGGGDGAAGWAAAGGGAEHGGQSSQRGSCSGDGGAGDVCVSLGGAGSGARDRLRASGDWLGATNESDAGPGARSSARPGARVAAGPGAGAPSALPPRSSWLRSPPRSVSVPLRTSSWRWRTPPSEVAACKEALCHGQGITVRSQRNICRETDLVSYYQSKGNDYRFMVIGAALREGLGLSCSDVLSNELQLWPRGVRLRDVRPEQRGAWRQMRSSCARSNEQPSQGHYLNTWTVLNQRWHSNPASHHITAKLRPLCMPSAWTPRRLARCVAPPPSHVNSEVAPSPMTSASDPRVGSHLDAEGGVAGRAVAGLVWRQEQAAAAGLHG